MKKLKFAFLGGVYPDDSHCLQADAKVSLDYAADAYQKKYLTAFHEKGIQDITVFSRLFLGSWPTGHKKWRVSYRGQSSFGEITYIDYLNFLGIRIFSQQKNTVREIRRWYSTLKEEVGVLFVYSACFSKEIQSIKKWCPNLKICTIVPDLPRFTYLSDRSLLRRCLVAKRQRDFEKSCRYVDHCICITEQMSKFINEKTGAACSTIEAIANKQRCEDNLCRLEAKKFTDPDKATDKVTILYTGTLAKKYGIVSLLEAFERLPDESYELVVCGGGDAEEEIKAFAEKDKRIHFLGIVSNDKAKELQTYADILVNPRKPTDEFTAYSFPSKTMEYLETGNMVVCYELPGIPSEYKPMLCLIEGDSTEALAETLQRTLEMSHSERIVHGKKVLHYLLEHKCGALLLDIIEKITGAQE